MRREKSGVAGASSGDGATLAYKAPDEGAWTNVSSQNHKVEQTPTSPEHGGELPNGVERFFWSGLWWYKVGERLFDSLDKAIVEAQNR